MVEKVVSFGAGQALLHVDVPAVLAVESSALIPSPALVGLPLFFLQNLVVVYALMMLAYFGISGILWLLFYSGFSINTAFLSITRSYLSKIQPSKGYSKETRAEEIKWSISTISVGSLLVTTVVVCYRLGVARLYWNVLDYGLPYYLFR